MRFSALDGLRIGVWGAGLETRSFARHVADRLDRARITTVVLEEPADAPELTADAHVVDAASAGDALRDCDVLVRSPGVSIYRPELQALTIPVTTPTGLWMDERGGRRVIGITATKGKSTTAKLTAHLIAAAGVPVQLAGNIGAPALDLLDTDELAVIELSSYQIADLPIGPEIALASNVYTEHVPWHQTVEAYRRDKLRLLNLPGVRRCVLNATSPEVMGAPRATDDVLTFGVAPGWHVTEDGSVARGDVLISELPLIGRHNALNVCGAATALEAVGLSVDVGQALADFVGLDHRLQIVHEADGVLWVDDSISTEPEAAKFAIEGFPERPIVLIGGGFDRGQDYTELGALLAAREARLLALPDTGGRLVDAARAAGVPDDRATLLPDLPSAVARARESATPGTVVLLSPAAPSFNTHRNYEARGNHFRDLAREA
jgi:UDP-N-acetylmuramoylalanine--D-glutamate ligase